ncbi:ABC transporter permease [Myxococcota bacterium]|nr:ABC transporter permease [Myxococcota bacterium]MBU1431285.1 ABC transporter permease [Myxococcota bacterium]MBU1900451.1 ABC transporter permease [Myxococcota bacterium]
MSQIFAIALNTFREATRNRVFASLILFAVAMLLLTLAVSSASLHEEVRLMKDIGLFLISTFSVLISIFIGVNLVYKEIERKTIFTIIPKPIFRFQFLLGKYFGLASTMLIQLIFMSTVLALIFWGLDANFGEEMVQALLLIYIEVLIVIAIALFFSSFSTPFLSGLLTIGAFIIGRFVDRILVIRLASKDEMTPALENVKTFVKTIAHIVPDLSIFNTTPYVVYEDPIDWSYVLNGVGYGVTYVIILLFLASLMFTRRDFI